MAGVGVCVWRVPKPGSGGRPRDPRRESNLRKTVRASGPRCVQSRSGGRLLPHRSTPRSRFTATTVALLSQSRRRPVGNPSFSIACVRRCAPATTAREPRRRTAIGSSAISSSTTSATRPRWQSPRSTRRRRGCRVFCARIGCSVCGQYSGGPHLMQIGPSRLARREPSVMVAVEGDP